MGDQGGKRSKQRPKVRGKRDVMDEWEVADIDRDEQKAGLERRKKRWQEIQLQIAKQKELEKKAIAKAEKMQNPKNRPPTPLEEAWLRCDYVLWNLLDEKAYGTMEWFRVNEPDAYKHIYKKLLSPFMMEHIQLYVNFFAMGGTTLRIPQALVRKFYMKYKGYRPTVSVQHGGKRKSLKEHLEDE